jgi:hypothetical protein
MDKKPRGNTDYQTDGCGQPQRIAAQFWCDYLISIQCEKQSGPKHHDHKKHSGRPRLAELKHGHASGHGEQKRTESEALIGTAHLYPAGVASITSKGVMVANFLYSRNRIVSLSFRQPNIDQDASALTLSHSALATTANAGSRGVLLHLGDGQLWNRDKDHKFDQPQE